MDRKSLWVELGVALTANILIGLTFVQILTRHIEIPPYVLAVIFSVGFTYLISLCYYLISKPISSATEISPLTLASLEEKKGERNSCLFLIKHLCNF